MEYWENHNELHNQDQCIFTYRMSFCNWLNIFYLAKVDNSTARSPGRQFLEYLCQLPIEHINYPQHIEEEKKSRIFSTVPKDLIHFYLTKFYHPYSCSFQPIIDFNISESSLLPPPPLLL